MGKDTTCDVKLLRFVARHSFLYVEILLFESPSESHELIKSKAALCEKEGKAENYFCSYLRIEIIILLVGSPNRYKKTNFIP